MSRGAMRSLSRSGASVLAGVLVAAAAVLGVQPPAQAAARVTVDASGQGAVIDSTYSTQLSVRGSGFNSIKGGHGGIYVWFGTVKGTWQPSKGGASGVNYVYVPDKEARNNAGFQRYVAYPDSPTAGSANGGSMSADGAWRVDLTVPGPVFDAVGRNGSTTRVDCRKVTCGVITIGAHGVKNGNNESFTPVRLGDLQASPAVVEEEADSPQQAPSAPAPVGATGSSAPKVAKGPAELKVDNNAAFSGRAMSFTATNLGAGEQFTVVLDDGLAAAGPFMVGADGRASGVIALPADTSAGTHELRLFGASKEASVKFGVSRGDEIETISVVQDEGEPIAGWIFAGLAGVVFLGALFVAVRRIAGGRRAQA